MDVRWKEQMGSLKRPETVGRAVEGVGREGGLERKILRWKEHPSYKLFGKKPPRKEVVDVESISIEDEVKVGEEGDGSTEKKDGRRGVEPVDREVESMRVDREASRLEEIDSEGKGREKAVYKIKWFMTSNPSLSPVLTLGPQIGSGAFATVHSARDLLSSPSLVAVKCFDKRQCLASCARARIQLELDILLLCRGLPNVVRLLRVAENQAQLLLVMDHWGETSLEEYVQRGHPVKGYREVARLLGNGLRGLHRAGVYHRDLKPANVMVRKGEDGKVELCLIDFGLASICPSRQEYDCPGTLCTKAPELVKHQVHDPGPADMWALGVILYYLVTKTYPFGGKQ